MQAGEKSDQNTRAVAGAGTGEVAAGVRAQGMAREMGQDMAQDMAEVGWASARRLPRACDEALSGTTRRWLRELPPRRRPLRLCQLYPRVANRLAWTWPDAVLSGEVLDDLLTDRRGGRQGFPRPVYRELERLRDFQARQRVEHCDEGLWRRLGRSLAWP